MMLVRSAGFKWKVEDLSPTGDVLGPFHEIDVESVLLHLIPVGGVFIDVGAHVGHYTLRASVKASRVLAVEANPYTASRLVDNLRLNQVKNVLVLNIAAWDCHTELELHGASEHDGSTRVAHKGAVTMQGQKVSAGPLDDYLGDLDRIDVVKLDVEGADLHALRGMQRTLGRCRPTLFIEDHSIYGYYARKDLEALLIELNYTWRDGATVGGGPFLIADPK